MTKVLYPGSFNPITKGHMDIIEKSLKLFDEVVVAVLVNPGKKEGFFTIDERVNMIKELYKENKNVKVITSNLSSVDLALENNCKAIVRGLRSLTDFDYELTLEQINTDLSNGLVNTICLFANKDYSFVSSSAVKEIFNLGKDITKYVDPLIYKKMIEKKEASK